MDYVLPTATCKFCSCRKLESLLRAQSGRTATRLGLKRSPSQPGGLPSSLIPVDSLTQRVVSLSSPCHPGPQPAEPWGTSLPTSTGPHQLCTSPRDVPFVAKFIFALSVPNYAYFLPPLASEQGRRRERKTETDLLSLCPRNAHFLCEI